jgi:anti-sigma28 factor (negative regulator of flagellin synthesis)
MRIEDRSSPPLKGQSVGRASDARSGDRKVGQGQRAGPDQVFLSGMATLAGGSPPARIEQLRNDVAEGTYHVPSDQVSRQIVEYYLGA